VTLAKQVSLDFGHCLLNKGNHRGIEAQKKGENLTTALFEPLSVFLACKIVTPKFQKIINIKNGIAWLE
jgi:hypothetical protein